jgi:glyoxylase-like metal-dependent hydrolase (beta-lactamase superfamily II)
MSDLLDLNWDVFVTPGIPTVTSDLPPGMKQQMWSLISSTLIYGRRDAVLVDAFITVGQEGALVDWAAASGKNLTMIDATHGHGDHFFGARTILQRFPRARLVAAPDVVKIMRQHCDRRIGDLGTTTAPKSLKRPGITFATSTA